MRWRPITLIVVLAVGIRLAWIALVPNAQYSDSVWYDASAANLAAHGIYGPDQPSAWFPPGYSFLLAAIYKVVGHSEIAGKLANVAIGGAITLFTFLLGRLVAGERVGLFAALVVALWPNLIFSTGILDSDLLAAAGFVAAMWLGMRQRRGAPVAGWQAWLLGALIGWMVLVRPVSLILLAALGLWWWMDAHSLRRAIVRLAPVVLTVAVFVGGWTIRNYLQFGEVITIATNGGYNFWQTNQPYADGNDTFWPFVPMDDPEYQTMRYGDEFTRNREGYRYAIAFLEAHPDHIIRMLPTKLFWLYHTDTSGFYEGALDAPMEYPSVVANWFKNNEHIGEAFTFRYYEALMVLGVLGLAFVLLRRSSSRWALTLISLPLLLTFFHLFFHAKDRFHIPLDGIVAIFAAVALVQAAVFATRWFSARFGSVAFSPRGASFHQ
jgi:4-amino-4-deoxy-L-arabinose transferase-like glycosyltransferase